MNLQNKVLALYNSQFKLIFKGRALDPVPFYEGMRILALETDGGEKVLIDFPSDGLIMIYEDWDDALRADAELPRPHATVLEDQVREIIRRNPGRKIQAIKEVRELTGFGLKEAKDLVDRLWE